MNQNVNVMIYRSSKRLGMSHWIRERISKKLGMSLETNFEKLIL